jgi:hypothetical protein
MESQLIPSEKRVYFVSDNETQVKPFAHPIVLESKSQIGEFSVVGDARSSSRLDRSTGTLTGGADFVFLKMRANLMDVTWVDGNPLDLLNAGDFQVKMYANLMSENIGRRLNLTMQTQIRIQIIAAYFYISQFYVEPPEDEDSIIKMAKRISRTVSIQIPEVLEVIEPLSTLSTLTDFTEALVSHGQSVRLEQLKPGILYTMLGGIWFGSNANETSAVALEHPPTFCAMLFMILEDRSYRKTILGQLVQKLDRRGDLSKPFSVGLKRMVKSD